MQRWLKSMGLKGAGGCNVLFPISQSGQGEKMFYLICLLGHGHGLEFESESFPSISSIRPFIHPFLRSRSFVFLSLFAMSLFAS